jgi:hypothetical protein
LSRCPEMEEAQREVARLRELVERADAELRTLMQHRDVVLGSCVADLIAAVCNAVHCNCPASLLVASACTHRSV